MRNLILLAAFLFAGCSSPVAPPPADSGRLPQSYAEADSLYQALGTTMAYLSPDWSSGIFSTGPSYVVLGKTLNGKIANVNVYWNRAIILHDSVSTADAYGIDIWENFSALAAYDLIVVFGDKDYAGNAMLRKLFINGIEVSGVYPFGEAKLFGGDKIISYQFVSSGRLRGISTKRYMIIDAQTGGVFESFDQQ